MIVPATATRRYLILSAGMGGGHDGVAAELARRLHERGHRTYRADVFDLLPPGMGAAIRTMYRLMLCHVPGRYQRTYDTFCDTRRGPRLVEPLVRLAGPTARTMLGEVAPDVVISTFHLAAAVTGRLRRQGAMRGRALVVLTEFAPHAVWLSPGNDAYLCLSPEAQRLAATRVGERAHWLGPLVRPPGHTSAARVAQITGAGHTPVVLLSAGSWGVATELTDTVRALAATGRYFPLALCGHNRRLLAQVRHGAGHRHAVGWRHDLSDLLAGAYALVENSGGQTCTEAFRAGTPVVIHAPLPGHGRAAARQLARTGAVRRSEHPSELITALDALPPGGAARSRQVERARALFRDDSTELLLRLAEPEAGRVPVSAASIG